MTKQLLHPVLGAELKAPGGIEFADLDKLDIVGIYPDYKTAYEAWRVLRTDRRRCHMRYFIVHLHRLLDPETDRSGQ